MCTKAEQRKQIEKKLEEEAERDKKRYHQETQQLIEESQLEQAKITRLQQKMELVNEVRGAIDVNCYLASSAALWRQGTTPFLFMGTWLIRNVHCVLYSLKTMLCEWKVFALSGDSYRWNMYLQ